MGYVAPGVPGGHRAIRRLPQIAPEKGLSRPIVGRYNAEGYLVVVNEALKDRREIPLAK
jgi:hypothetical protein